MGFLNRHRFEILGAIAASGYLIAGILKSTNSTASIGFLFVPLALAFGAFAGYAVQYGIDVLRKRRTHSPGKTLLIVAVFGFCAYRFVHHQANDQDLKLAESSTSGAELARLLEKGDARILRALAANPSLPAESLVKIIKEHLPDYDVMSGAIQSSNLGASEMERIAALERSDFKGDVEYELYQTYVWAPLAKRKDVPETLIHKLAGKKNPAHFLILALIDSPSLACDERKRFLPQPNAVLENAVQRSMESQKCPRSSRETPGDF